MPVIESKVDLNSAETRANAEAWAGLRDELQQHRATADGGNTPGVRGCKVQPVHHRGALQLVHAASGNDNGVERLAWVQLRQAIVRQQI